MIRLLCVLSIRTDVLASVQVVSELNAEYEKLKNELQENETYIQVCAASCSMS